MRTTKQDFITTGLGTTCQRKACTVRVAGGNPTLYGYVWDSTGEVDVFGLDISAPIGNSETGVRHRLGEAVEPMERTYEMYLNPDEHIDAVVEKYGINLRGSGQDIKIVYNPDLYGPGISREITPNIIEVGPKALISDEELANTIAHELNHARSWLKGGEALEPPAYDAGDALADYINGGR